MRMMFGFAFTSQRAASIARLALDAQRPVIICDTLEGDGTGADNPVTPSILASGRPGFSHLLNAAKGGSAFSLTLSAQKRTPVVRGCARPGRGFEELTESWLLLTQ